MILPIRVYWSRRWLYPIVGALIIALIIVLGRLSQFLIVLSHRQVLPTLVQSLGWIGLIFIGWRGVRLIRNLARQRLMFEISEEGLTTYYDRTRFDYVQPGYLIPWCEIEEIKWIERTALGANKGIIRQRRIELTLKDADRVPVEKISLYFDQSSPRAVAIDATTGSLSGKKLFELLQQVWENQK